MNKRQISAEETRKKLLNAAISLLHEKGFAAINVDDITNKAGVSKGSFYTYFKRKEDIVLEITRAPYQQIYEKMQEMQGKEITEKLAFYMKNFMACIDNCGLNLCRQWTRDLLDPANTPDNKDARKWDYDVKMLQKILDEAVADNQLIKETPVLTLTHLLISQLYGMMTCWCMSDTKFSPLEWIDKFSEIQLKAVFEPYLVKGKDNE